MVHSLKYNGSYWGPALSIFASYANMVNAGPQAPYYPYSPQMAFVNI